jgi:translocation and assembly module TamB
MRFKPVYRIFRYVLLTLASLFVLILLLVNLPPVQRLITSRINMLLKEKNIPAHVDKISLLLNGKIRITNIAIIKPPEDTVIFASDLRVSVSPLGFLSKKVKAAGISLDNGVIHLSVADTSGKLNLLALFPASGKPKEAKSKPSKQWDISVKSITLKNIRFSFEDTIHGMTVKEDLTSFYIRFSHFSIADREIHAAHLRIDHAHTSLATGPKKDVAQADKDTSRRAASWKFELDDCVLNSVSFTLYQPESEKRMDASLGKGVLGNVLVQLNQPGSGDEQSSAFPIGITVENMVISNGMYAMTGGPAKGSKITHRDTFSVNGIHGNFENSCLTNTCSGFKARRLTASLANGVRLKDGQLELKQDADGTTLTAGLETRESSLKINLKSETGRKKIWETDLLNLPFTLSVSGNDIAVRDILAFAPAIPLNRNETLNLEGVIHGTIRTMIISRLQLTTKEGLKATVTGKMEDLPEMDRARFNLSLQTGIITHAAVTKLLASKGNQPAIPEFKPLTIRATLMNSIKEPGYEVIVSDLKGNLQIKGTADLTIKSYHTELNLDDFDLGGMASVPELQRATGSIVVDGKGLKPSDFEAVAQVKLDSVTFKGHRYQGVNADVKTEKGAYTFHIHSSDASAMANLTGNLSIGETMEGHVTGTFAVYPSNLNLYRDSLYVKGNLDARLLHSSSKTDASVMIQNLDVRKSNHAALLKSTSLGIAFDNNSIVAYAKSDFMTADFKSDTGLNGWKEALKKAGSFHDLLSDTSDVLYFPFLSSLPRMTGSLDATYHPMIAIFAADSVFSFHHVKLKLDKDSSGHATANLSADRFRLGSVKVYSAKADLGASAEQASMTLNADSIRTRYTGLANPVIELALNPQNATFTLHTDGKKDTALYDLSVRALKRGRNLELQANRDEWILNGYTWTVSPSTFLVIEPGARDLVADLHWKTSESRIDIQGRLSEKINVNLSKVELSKLILPGILPYDFMAELNGNISYGGGAKKILETDMQLVHMKLSDEWMGDVKLEGKYAYDTLGNAEGELKMNTSKGSSLGLSLTLLKNRPDKIHALFDNVSLAYAEPFLSSYVSGLNGNISGEMDRTKQLNGHILLKQTGFRIIALNAPFTIPGGEIKVQNSRLIFDHFTVLDSLNKKLDIQGNVDVSDPKSMKTDLNISSENLQVMNTTEKDNPSFFGSVFINSKLHVSGILPNPSISGNLALAGGSVINYRYTENLNVSEAQKMVTFARFNEDPSETAKRQNSIRNMSSSPYMEASIEIDPNSIFNFEISRGFDISVSISGGGFLNYAVMPNNAMSLSGRYEIRKGSSDLKITGWPRKNFDITPGSFLQWDGRADDPELHIETVSKVRGSYLNPVDNRNREVDFKVLMKLTNRLSQLDISFDVSSDDQYITSVINSLSNDERMRQAINLLVFERIELPNMASSSNYMSQQINQFWETQLNQFTKSAFKNVDVSFGLNTYKGVSESGGEQEYTSFTYQVKKEMFKDRGSVMVSGKMNDNSAAGDQSNNMIENFTFEYALDTNRSKYLKIYRQQNYEDLLEGEVIKSGVGFIYRKNYDRLSDIWRRRKNKKDAAH